MSEIMSKQWKLVIILLLLEPVIANEEIDMEDVVEFILCIINILKVIIFIFLEFGFCTGLIYLTTIIVIFTLIYILFGNYIDVFIKEKKYQPVRIALLSIGSVSKI